MPDKIAALMEDDRKYRSNVGINPYDNMWRSDYAARLTVACREIRRQRRWIRRWRTSPPVSFQLNAAMKRLADEMDSALRGKSPSKKRS
jgi:hypothetical protein